MGIALREQTEVRVEITEAGKENLLLRALLRQVLPLLRHPTRYSEVERSLLLQNVCIALEESREDEEEREDPW